MVMQPLSVTDKLGDEYVNVDTISVILLLTFFPMSLHIKAMQKICLDEIYIMKHLIRYCKM